MGALWWGMANTHRSCDTAQLHKNEPWITQRTYIVRVNAVVIEVWGCQPQVDIIDLLHNFFKFTRLALLRFLCPPFPGFDWCCFYYFVRNSLIALLEYSSRISFFRFLNIEFFLNFFLVCKVSNKASLPPLSTRLLCLVVAIPLVGWLYMCARVCVPLCVHMKMCRWSDKYLANISITVTTSRAVLT